MCAPCTTKSLVNRIIQQWSFIWCFVWYVCIQYLICAHDNNNSGVLHAHFIIWLNPSGISIMVYCLLFSCFSSCFTLYSDIRIVKRSLFQWSMWRWCRHTDTHKHTRIYHRKINQLKSIQWNCDRKSVHIAFIQSYRMMFALDTCDAYTITDFLFITSQLPTPSRVLDISQSSDFKWAVKIAATIYYYYHCSTALCNIMQYTYVFGSGMGNLKDPEITDRNELNLGLAKNE